MNRNGVIFKLCDAAVVCIVSFCVLCLMATDLYASYNRNVSAYAAGKSCRANLKTIEGAVELYLMENTSAVSSVEVLVEKGYLKAEPKCPLASSKSYVFEKPVSKAADFFSSIKCPTHGHYSSADDSFDDELKYFRSLMSVRRNFMFFVATAILFLLLWQYVILRKKNAQCEHVLARRTKKPDGEAENLSGGAPVK